MMRTGRPKMDRQQTSEFLAKTIPKAKETLHKIQQGELEGDVFVSLSFRASNEPMAKLWRNFAELAARLERLAEKRLAGTPFTPDEKDFILHYGRPLARLMFHIGDHSETPRDDVPRIADVVHNAGGGKYLEVGVGRPRIMYVLYPTAAGDVFCGGAVLPYYEFRSPARLDDIEWKALLDSSDAPKPLIEREAFLSPNSQYPAKQAIWRRSWRLTLGIGTAIAIAACLAVRRWTRRRSTPTSGNASK